MRKILPSPILDFNYLFAKTKGLPDVFLSDRVAFYSHARVALLDGLISLGIKETDTVLLPSYICNVVLAPFNYLKIKVKFYDVLKNLQPNIDDIISKIDRSTKAILAVNYFGFPTNFFELKQVCEQKRLFFIEDNAHGLFSKADNTYLGTIGDIAIFSIRKTLPVPNGAALKINNPTIKFLHNKVFLRKHSYISNLTFLFRQLNANLDDVFGINMVNLLKKLFGKQFVYDPKEESIKEETNIEKYFVKQSFLTDIIFKKVDVEHITKTRRKTFIYLLNQKLDGEPLFKTLPDGVVPYAFPMYVEDPQKSIQELYKKGICAWPWPTLPSNLKSYPDFYKKIILLPVWRDYEH